MSFLGDAAKTIFGEKPKTSNESLSTLNTAQEKAFQQMMDSLMTRFSSGQGLGMGVTPTETNSLKGLEALGAQANAAVARGTPQASQNLLNTAQTRLQGIMTQGPADINNYFEKSVQDPAVANLTNNILPQIRQRFGGNFYGGERQNSEAKAVGALTQQLASSRAQMAYDARQADIQSSLQAAQLSPGTANAAATLPFQVQQAGAQTLDTINKGVGTVRDAGQKQIDNQNMQIQQIMQMLGLKTKENLVTQDAGSQGLLSQLGPLIAAAGMVAMSDRRTKTEIRKVDQLPNGLPIYEFEYKADPGKRYLGVMADEVLQVRPEAVIDVGGILFVDYSQIV